MSKTNISDSEWAVMQIIWNDQPVTAKDIVTQLETTTPWKEKTIKTLISRLLKKELIGFEKKGREYIYHALITRDQCMKAENKSFLKRVYSGNLGLMFASFIQQENLSSEEIEQLKELLDQNKEET